MSEKKILIPDCNTKQDYENKWFIPRIKKRLESVLREELHNCGMCRNFSAEKGRTDYGVCCVDNATKGYDCHEGHDCRDFEASKTFRYMFHVEVVSE